MRKSVDDNEVLYHVELSKNMLQGATYAILTGDPGRVPKLAEKLGESPKKLTFHREYHSYLTYVQDTPVLICSTGIGGPSMAIALEELACLGIKSFIRMGTTGGISPNINIGDLIINHAAVRLDGTSRHYAPIEYPAVASLELTHTMTCIAKQLGIAHHVGVVASSDSFWPGQERYDSYTGYVPRDFQGSLKEWQQLGVLNYEMEIATLFTVARTFGLRAAAVCLALVNRNITETAMPEYKLQEAENTLHHYLKALLQFCIENNI